MRRKIIVFPFFLLLVVLVSCSRTPSVVLEDNTCNAPCWRTIDAGKTSQEEAMNIIAKMPDIQEDSIKQEKTFLPMMEDAVYWKFQGAAEFNADISFHDLTVVMLTFNFAHPIGLKDFIHKFGEPSSVYISSSQGPGVYLTVSLIYPNKGICLFHQPKLLPLQNPNEYAITQATQINDVYYTDPTIQNSQLIIGCLRGLESDEFKMGVQEWSGYKKYVVHKQGK